MSDRHDDNGIHRRAFLRGLGGAAVSLPVMGTGLSSLAAAATGDSNASDFPKRFVVFFHPNGVINDAWWPENVQSETEWELGKALDPLSDFKDKLLFMKGLNMDAAASGPGGPHQQGMGGVLTGQPLQEGDMVGNDGSLAGWGDGISIDQAIAEKIGQNTKYKSLQLGVRGDTHGGSRVRTRLSYAGPAEPIPPQNDPRAVFDQLFSDVDTGDGAMDKIRQQRRSVLDSVREQFDMIKKRVGSSDREKLEAHLAKIRDLERRLQDSKFDGEGCAVPPKPEDRDPDSESTMPEVMQAQLDLGIMAMACDLTRVVSVQVSNSVNHIRYPWLNSMGDGHALSHAGPSNEDAREQWIARDQWHAQQFAYMLEQLDSIPEGDGTMLDNTVLLWVMEIAQGNTHSLETMPFVVAGNVDNQLKTGRYVQYSGTKSHNDLLTTLGKLYDLDINSFGDERFCNGPLSGIT